MPAAPTDEELAKADKGLPVFDPREETPPGEPFPDTPSGAALMEVGNLNGEEVPVDKLIDAGVHGEAYQAAKRRRRWGAGRPVGRVLSRGPGPAQTLERSIMGRPRTGQVVAKEAIVVTVGAKPPVYQKQRVYDKRREDGSR